MPGPLSAPNGDKKLVNRKPEEFKRINTGKTALKNGEIRHTRRQRPSRAERERQEQE